MYSEIENASNSIMAKIFFFILNIGLILGLLQIFAVRTINFHIINVYY